jgi:hypothetical protein
MRPSSKRWGRFSKKFAPSGHIANLRTYLDQLRASDIKLAIIDTSPAIAYNTRTIIDVPNLVGGRGPARPRRRYDGRRANLNESQRRRYDRGQTRFPPIRSAHSKEHP